MTMGPAGLVIDRVHVERLGSWRRTTPELPLLLGGHGTQHAQARSAIRQSGSVDGRLPG